MEEGVKDDSIELVKGNKPPVVEIMGVVVPVAPLATYCTGNAVCPLIARAVCALTTAACIAAAAADACELAACALK